MREMSLMSRLSTMAWFASRTYCPTRTATSRGWVDRAHRLLFAVAVQAECLARTQIALCKARRLVLDARTLVLRHVIDR